DVCSSDLVARFSNMVERLELRSVFLLGWSESSERISNLDPLAGEREQCGGAAARTARTCPLARVVQYVPAEEDSLQVGSGESVAQRCRIVIPKCRHRELLRNQGESDVGVAEFGSESVTGVMHDLIVVESSAGQHRHRMPCGVLRNHRFDIRRHQSPERCGEYAWPRDPVGGAERGQLLDMFELGEIDLLGQVAADRGLDVLPTAEPAAG